ncbi:MAG: hypothetical protein NTV84_10955 [Methanoregula sp.]|nr:hypothetical protein [Methanoregula sp.]
MATEEQMKKICLHYFSPPSPKTLKSQHSAAPSIAQSRFYGKSARKTVFRFSSRRVRIHGLDKYPIRVQLMPGPHPDSANNFKNFHSHPSP